MEPDRILFGEGSEATFAGALIDAGARAVLVVGPARHPEGVERLVARLGDRALGVFLTEGAQVPEAVVASAVERARGADWVVAHGGGTAIGIAKAVALELEVRVGAVPTTYSGSERTDIWGVLKGGGKVTGRDPRVRPRLVAYDPALLAGLRFAVAGPSLVNALAHAVEALYVDPTAVDAVPPILAGLDGLRRDPDDRQAATVALWGAWLAAEAWDPLESTCRHASLSIL